MDSSLDFAKKIDAFAPWSPSVSLGEGPRPVKQPDGVKLEGWRRTVSMDSAVDYRIYILDESFFALLTKNGLYVKKELWFELQQYPTGERGLTCVFATVLKTLPRTLDILRPRPVSTQVTELDEDLNVVARHDVIEA